MGRHKAPTSNTEQRIPIKQGIYEASTTQQAALGTRMTVGNRTFHYAQVTDATAAGLVVSAPVISTMNYSDLGAAAANPGTTEVVLTCVTTLTTAGFFNDGYLVMQDVTTGLGEMYAIKSHTIGAAATSAVTFTLYDPIIYTITAASDASVFQNVYSANQLATNGAADSAFPTGACPTYAAALSYVWLQTWGPCGVIGEAALTTHTPVCVSATANSDGHVVTHAITSQAVTLGPSIIGMSGYATNGAGEGALIYLQIAP